MERGVGILKRCHLMANKSNEQLNLVCLNEVF